jgi:predicted MPP superfamily phosphohydrolase
LSEKGGNEEKWESRPGGIWVLRSNKRHVSDSEKVVTAVDVLFGPDAAEPRHGWELSRIPLQFDTGAQDARLTIRHGQPKTGAEKEPHPRVKKDGRFKILQISDAHLATGIGTCRDAIGPNGQPSVNCEADPRTLNFIESVLDDEKPDLVILSGDQVEGPAAPDTQTAIFKITAPLIERKIPYAAIFGNHDDESDLSLSRAQQMDILQTLPYSLSHPGPRDVDGVGNYYVEVLAPSPSQHSAITIYLLDTHGLSPDEKNYKGYDWLKPSQISWFKSTAQGLRAEHKKYTHIHLDMAFIHIPLPEFADAGNKIAGGQVRENVMAPRYNSHFYDALAEEGIVAVGAGHDHCNDYCALRPVAADAEHHSTHGGKGSQHLGPWMCYAGGSGFGGYAGYGEFHRRVRVWEVDTNAGKIMTWKRLECCTDEETKRKVDEIMLVQSGVVQAPSS